MKVKEKILHTATNLFQQQGYNTTGINQIIEESGVAKGSFYYNFKSKEDLCVEFLNTRHTFWMDKLRTYVKKNRSKSEDAPILLAFDFLYQMNKSEKFRGCSFLNILSEISDDNTKVLSIIQDHKNDVRLYIEELLSNDDLSDHVYLLFEGALIESQLFKNQWPVEQGRKFVKSLIK